MIMLCSVGFGGGGICGFVVKVASGVTCGFFVSYCLLWYCERLLLFGYFRLFFARWLNVLFGCFMVDLRICLVGFW